MLQTGPYALPVAVQTEQATRNSSQVAPVAKQPPKAPPKMVRIAIAALLGSAAAFAPRAAVPATRTVVFAGEDYASMDGPALAAAIDGKRKELFDMRLENRQGRQKTTFKSNVVRNLKKDIARMMPFLEAKQASGCPNVALREQAKGRRARKEKVEA